MSKQKLVVSRIGIIGCGTMGAAIATGLRGRFEITVYDTDAAKMKALHWARSCENVLDLMGVSETVVIAVKPQDLKPVLGALASAPQRPLLISIAAGITTAFLEHSVPKSQVFRAMPNIGLTIGESVTCVCRGSTIDEDHVSFSQELFYYLGAVREVSESMMDAATAISGSGPAYIFEQIAQSQCDPMAIPERLVHDMMKRLERAAEAVGFNVEDATFLAAHTAATAISVLKKTHLGAAALVSKVASKGGTTEAALAVLRAGGSWEDAARAALKRAGELQQGR